MLRERCIYTALQHIQLVHILIHIKTYTRYTLPVRFHRYTSPQAEFPPIRPDSPHYCESPPIYNRRGRERGSVMYVLGKGSESVGLWKRERDYKRL